MHAAICHWWEQFECQNAKTSGDELYIATSKTISAIIHRSLHKFVYQAVDCCCCHVSMNAGQLHAPICGILQGKRFLTSCVHKLQHAIHCKNYSPHRVVTPLSRFIERVTIILWRELHTLSTIHHPPKFHQASLRSKELHRHLSAKAYTHGYRFLWSICYCPVQ